AVHHDAVRAAAGDHRPGRYPDAAARDSPGQRARLAAARAVQRDPTHSRALATRNGRARLSDANWWLDHAGRRWSAAASRESCGARTAATATRARRAGPGPGAGWPDRGRAAWLRAAPRAGGYGSAGWRDPQLGRSTPGRSWDRHWQEP